MISFDRHKNNGKYSTHHMAHCLTMIAVNAKHVLAYCDIPPDELIEWFADMVEEQEEPTE